MYFSAVKGNYYLQSAFVGSWCDGLSLSHVELVLSNFAFTVTSQSKQCSRGSECYPKYATWEPKKQQQQEGQPRIFPAPFLPKAGHITKKRAFGWSVTSHSLDKCHPCTHKEGALSPEVGGQESREESEQEDLSSFRFITIVLALGLKIKLGRARDRR